MSASAQSPSPSNPLPDSIRLAQITASTFRALTWNLTIPVEVRLAVGPTVSGADGGKGKGKEKEGFVAGTDIGGRGGIAGGVERYYMQVPRHTYLPLLLPELKENFILSALAQDEVDALSGGEGDWWFEVDLSGDENGEEEGGEPVGSGEMCRWHWTIDLIQTLHLLNSPRPTSPHHPQTLRLILHLQPHPFATVTQTSAALPHPPALVTTSASLNDCAMRFNSSVKEADYVRWGNTRRVTGLRRLEMESGWGSIVEGDFDSYTQFALKTLPLPLPLPSSSETASISSGSNQSHSQQAGQPTIGSANSTTNPDSIYAMRGVPVKVYLPMDAPVLQEGVAPVDTEGKPTTVYKMLQQLLPSLFPQITRSPYHLAIPYLHGVELPPEAEVAWLGSCSSGPDGWLRIGVRLRDA